MADLKQRLAAYAREIGFDAVGFAEASVGPREQARLDELIERGEYGTMGWMAARAEERRDPKALWGAVRSVIVLGTNYGPKQPALSLLDHPERANISVYARNKDYHDIVKRRLKQLARWLIAEAGGDVKVFVDTAPVMEKALAARSALGWQGKHTNLVSRQFGSWLFLGEVFTTLEIAPDGPEADHCGRCTACQTACPTDAFPAPYKLDPRRCLSYLTIEHDGPIPEEFRAAMGNRIYGCDDCLAVCPWNKFASATRELAFIPRAELTAPRLADFLDFTDADFRAFFSGSPIKRIGRSRFLRNVLIALGNSGRADLIEKARPLAVDPDPVVAEAAGWCLSRAAG